MKKYKLVLIALSLVWAVAMSGCCKDFVGYSDVTREHRMDSLSDMPTEGCVAFTLNLFGTNLESSSYIEFAEGKSAEDWTTSSRAVTNYSGKEKAQGKLEDAELSAYYFDIEVVGWDFTQEDRPIYLQFSYNGLELNHLYDVTLVGYANIVDENNNLIATMNMESVSPSDISMEITHEHTYGEMQVLQSATADKEGIIGIACTKCGHVKDSCKLPNDALVLAKVLADLEDQIADAEEGTVIVLDLQHYHSLPASIMKHIITCGYDVELKYIYQGTHYDITIKNGKGIDCDVEWYGPLFMNHLYGENAEN